MPIATIPSERLDHHRRGYPRPQLVRDEWYSLNGRWEFALDVDGVWQAPEEVRWSAQQILVPFAPEAPASGIVRWVEEGRVGLDIGAIPR